MSTFHSNFAAALDELYVWCKKLEELFLSDLSPCWLCAHSPLKFISPDMDLVAEDILSNYMPACKDFMDCICSNVPVLWMPNQALIEAARANLKADILTYIRENNKNAI